MLIIGDEFHLILVYLNNTINNCNIVLQAIQEHAEENAEKFVFQNESVNNYTYYSSKYSNMSNSAINLQISNLIRKFPSLKGNKPMYRRMMLDNDTHFYNLMVNTTHSAVHVPVNIYDKGKSSNRILILKGQLIAPIASILS